MQIDLTLEPSNSFSNLQFWRDMATNPHDLAGRVIHLDNKFCRVHFRLPQKQARWRARREFRFFPADAYLTEIEQWRELADGDIEFTVKRLRERRPPPK